MAKIPGTASIAQRLRGVSEGPEARSEWANTPRYTQLLLLEAGAPGTLLGPVKN